MLVYQLLTFPLIFSLPFFPNQFANDNIKNLIMLFSIFLLPIFFRALLNDIKRRFFPTFFFLLFLIPLTIATIFSTEKEQSVVQLRLFLSYFVIFVSSRSIFSTFKNKELLATCYLLLAAILSLISLYNTLIRHYVSTESLSFLWIYHGHNHLSALLVFAIPLSLYFLKAYWPKKQIRILLLVTCILLIVSLFFTFSISATLSLAIAFLISFMFFEKIISPKNFPLKKVYFIVFLIIAFFGISSFYIFSETKGIKIKYVSPQTNTTKKIRLHKDPQTYAEARFIYWRAAYDNFLKNPLIGSGLETFGEVLAKSGNIGKAAYTTHAHNFFIQMLTDTGIFGFLTSIMLIGSVLWQGYQKIRNTLVGNESFFYTSLYIGILSSALFSTIDLDWHAPTVFLFFWIFASILSVRSESKDYAN